MKILPSTQKLYDWTHTCSNVTDNRRARSRALPNRGKVSRLSWGVSVLTNVITGNKQVVNCTQPFHRISLLAIKTANLLSKFPFFFQVSFPTPQLVHLTVCLTSFYWKPLLIMWSGSHSVDPWAGQLFNLTSSPSFGLRLRRAAEWRENTLAHAYWRYLAGPFLCFHFWPLFFLSPQENTELGGYLRSPSFPSPSNFCCPVLWNPGLMQDQRMVIHVQQVPVPWKPQFSPQNIPFYPFWRPVTGQSRHRTTPGQAMTKPIFCLLLDGLKKTF